VLGCVLCALLGEQAHVWQVAAACFVVGVGLGLTNVPTLVAVQSVVGWRHRGVVTATNMFSRSIGSAVGVAVFGAIANAAYASSSAHVGATSDSVPHPAALYEATHHVFVGLVGVAVLMLGAVMLVPRTVHELDVDALTAA